MATTTSIQLGRRTAVAIENITLVAGWTLGSSLAALALWVVIPAALLGWNPLVVTSGSMEPLIGVGDVVLIDRDYRSPGRDSVVAYQLDDEVVLHRVVSVTADGALVTKGDANPGPDSGVVAPDRLLGAGRILVPFIGLIAVVDWMWPAAVCTLILATLVVMRGRPLFVVSGLVVASLLATPTAVAAFGASTSNTGSSMSAIDLAPPTSLSADCTVLGTGDVEVDLTWSASPTPGIDGYRVYHDGPSAGTDFSEVGTTTTTSFTHTFTASLTIVGTHTYMVRSYDDMWESEDSNLDSVEVTEVSLVFACSG